MRTVEVPASGDVTVEMGVPAALEASPAVDGLPGTAVSMGNPHVVVEIADLNGLAALDLARPPAVRPALPDGQNVEYVVRRGPRSLAMRVHERGVGETRSCGTGVCAAVVCACMKASGPPRNSIGTAMFTIMKAILSITPATERSPSVAGVGAVEVNGNSARRNSS